MPTSEESKLIIRIDKNLEVLVNRFEQETRANGEFKAEVKALTSNIQTRLRDIEIWKSKTEVGQEDGKFIKQTVIRWVIVNMLTSAGAICGMVYLFSQGA